MVNREYSLYLFFNRGKFERKFNLRVERRKQSNAKDETSSVLWVILNLNIILIYDRLRDFEKI